MSKLSKLIKSRRESLGLSQLQVANSIGYAYLQNISYFESGKRNLPLDKFRPLATALDLPIEVLIETHFQDLESTIRGRGKYKKGVTK